MEINLNVKTKYNIGDKVYTLCYNNRGEKRVYSISHDFIIANISIEKCTNKNEASIFYWDKNRYDNYSENWCFKTEEEAQTQCDLWNIDDKLAWK